MMSKALVPLGKGRMYCWGCRHEVNPRRPYVGIRLRKGVMRVWHPDCAPKRTMTQARRNACKMNPRPHSLVWWCPSCNQIVDNKDVARHGKRYVHELCQEEVERTKYTPLAQHNPLTRDETTRVKNVQAIALEDSKKYLGRDPHSHLGHASRGEHYAYGKVVDWFGAKQNPQKYKSNDGDWIRKGIMYKGPLVPGGAGGVDFRVVMWGAKRHGDKMEYGTHHMFFPKTGEPYFAYGHYFGPKMQSALADFNKRVWQYKNNPKRMQENPWKFKVGETVQIKSSKWVPKIWRGKMVKIIGTHITTTRGGFKNPWYTVKDLQTGRVSKSFDSTNLERVGEKNPTRATHPDFVFVKKIGKHSAGIARGRYAVVWKHLPTGWFYVRRRASHRPFADLIGQYIGPNPALDNHMNPLDYEEVGEISAPLTDKLSDAIKRQVKRGGAHPMAKKNPWHHAGTFRSSREARRLAKSFSIESFPTRLTKAGGRGIGVEYYTQPETPTPYTPEWFEYMEKVKSGALTERLGPEAITPAPMRWGVGTARARPRRERALFRQMFPFESYPFGKGKGKANPGRGKQPYLAFPHWKCPKCNVPFRMKRGKPTCPKCGRLGNIQTGKISKRNPYLVRGVRKGRYMEKPIRSRKAARRALGRLGRHSQKIKITEREYRRISGWGGHGPRPLRKWRPVGQVMLQPGTYKLARRGKRFQNNPRGRTQGAKYSWGTSVADVKIGGPGIKTAVEALRNIKRRVAPKFMHFYTHAGPYVDHHTIMIYTDDEQTMRRALRELKDYGYTDRVDMSETQRYRSNPKLIGMAKKEKDAEKIAYDYMRKTKKPAGLVFSPRQRIRAGSAHRHLNRPAMWEVMTFDKGQKLIGIPRGMRKGMRRPVKHTPVGDWFWKHNPAHRVKGIKCPKCNTETLTSIKHGQARVCYNCLTIFPSSALAKRAAKRMPKKVHATRTLSGHRLPYFPKKRKRGSAYEKIFGPFRKSKRYRRNIAPLVAAAAISAAPLAIREGKKLAKLLTKKKNPRTKMAISDDIYKLCYQARSTRNEKEAEKLYLMAWTLWQKALTKKDRGRSASWIPSGYENEFSGIKYDAYGKDAKWRRSLKNPKRMHSKRHARRNPRKYRIGELVKVRTGAHIPKIWRGKKAKIIGYHKTRTDRGFTNYWYKVKDPKTGRVTKAFNANRLEKLSTRGQSTVEELFRQGTCQVCKQSRKAHDFWVKFSGLAPHKFVPYKKNPSKRLHPAYTRMQRGLRRQYLQRGERALLKSMKRNPREKIRPGEGGHWVYRGGVPYKFMGLCGFCNKRKELDEHIVGYGYLCSKCAIKYKQRLRRKYAKRHQERIKKGATRVGASKLISHEIEGEKKYRSLASKFGRGSRPYLAFQSMAKQERSHAKKIERLKRLKYIQNRRPSAAPKRRTSIRKIRPRRKPKDPEDYHCSKCYTDDCLRIESGDAVLCCRCAGDEGSDVCDSCSDGWLRNPQRPSAARREELRSKLSKLKRGQSVRPPKEWWAGKGKKRGMLRKISTSKKYRRRSHAAKARITAGIWHKGYSRPAKIRTVQKIMSGKGGIPNPKGIERMPKPKTREALIAMIGSCTPEEHWRMRGYKLMGASNDAWYVKRISKANPAMTRRELILKAQEAEDNYAATGKTHYKMVAMQIRDELAATATLRARQPIPAKHYPKPEYDRCNQGHLLQEVYDERYNEYRWDCPLCMSRMRNNPKYKANPLSCGKCGWTGSLNAITRTSTGMRCPNCKTQVRLRMEHNPLGPTMRRVPRGIAKHVRRVARTRRPIVRGKNYFTPARGGVQVFRGKKASFVEV